jgi:hypothetical protein
MKWIMQFSNITRILILKFVQSCLLPRKSAQAVTILPYVWEASGSNLTWDTDNHVVALFSLSKKKIP